MTSLIIINVILSIAICWIIVKSHMQIQELEEDLHDANVEIADKVATIAELEHINKLARERNGKLSHENDRLNAENHRLKLALDKANKMIYKLKKPTHNEE